MGRAFRPLEIEAAMKFPLCLIALCATFALLLPASASAQSFRCKKDLVNLGDSKATVLLTCGEPVVRDSFCRPLDPSQIPAAPRGSTAAAVVPCETVDEWTYNPGYGQFWTTLRFESGALKAIKYGDWVK
jgi:hypothetical protein